MSSQPYPSAVPASVAVAAGTTAADAVAAAGVALDRAVRRGRRPRPATDALRDLDWAPDEDARVEPVALDSGAGCSVLRHSTAHVLAQAVQDLFPDAKLGIGPPIENGFYYDFAVAKPFHPDDLDRLEKRMQEIVKAGQRFRRRRFDSIDEARAELADEPFKLELVDLKGAAEDTEEVMEVGGGELTIYDNLDPKPARRVWGDLCRGPHLPSTRLIGAFKLMRTAAAYWRGSEKNPQLQRFYGTAWPTRDALKAYLELLEEAAGATTASSARSWTCSASRTRSAPGWPCSTPRAASSGASWRTTRRTSTRRPGTRSSTPRTSPRPSCSRPPATCDCTPTPCSRRWRWRARSTTSSR